jgi:hypothetical protein
MRQTHYLITVNIKMQKNLRSGLIHFNLVALFAAGIFAAGLPRAFAITLAVATNATEQQIQTALDKLPEGGELVLPAGTYEIHHPIVLERDGEILRGSGPTTILHLADHANCPVILMGSPNARRMTSHLRVADLFIDGNRKHQQVELWRPAPDGSQLMNNGIDVWNVTDAAVDRVSCRSCRSGGLVSAVARDLRVRDFTSSDNQFDGLACYYTEDSRFSGLKLHDNLAAGISLDLGFNHNVISDAVISGNDLGIFMRQACDNSFQGLTIIKSRKHGIFMAQANRATKHGWQLASGTECTGNTFADLVINEYGGDAFLIHNLSCKNNVIHDARFSKNVQPGVMQTAINLVNTEDLIHQ